MSKPQRWSPLTCLTPAPLSPSGLIILESDDGEVETLVRTNVELRYNGSGPLPLPRSAATGKTKGPWNACDTNLSCHVTTHRLVLLDEKEPVGGFIPFHLVQTAVSCGGPSFRSPRASYKIDLSTYAWGDLTLVFRGGDTSSYSQSAKDRDDVLNSIHRAINRKAWQDKERQKMKEQLRPSRGVNSRKVGVDAIMTQNALRHRENANLADAAFGGNSEKTAKKNISITSSAMKKKSGSSNDTGDIDRFLIEAADLIKVIEKYAATIDRERAVSAPSDDQTNGEDTAKLVGMLENMGMASALSAKQSGSMYHKQLARQLVDFLRHKDKLTKAGGMMTLTDVYCLFNRARGTNMISPEDMLKSLDWMIELKLGMSKRSFSSGVVVIQDDSFDDENVAKKLAELAVSSLQHDHILPASTTALGTSIGGITVMDVSKSLQISALLANEHLLSAEQMGWLCRDSTIEGIRFFPNLFKSGDYSLYLSSSVR